MRFKKGDKVRVVKPDYVVTGECYLCSCGRAMYWIREMDEMIGNEEVLEESNDVCGYWRLAGVPYNFLEDWLEPVEDETLDSSKRHPHADLMISYANDCTQIVELVGWGKVQHPRWHPDKEYHLRPRKRKMTLAEIEEIVGELVEIVEEEK